MKSINETITVDARNGVPRRVWWDRHPYRTRKLLDYWILQTRWWGREERRIYFRLMTDGGVVMEIYRTASDGSAAAASRETVRSKGKGSVRRERPPLPMEGDTHIRERRRTDAVYRPDLRREGACRSGEPSPPGSARGSFHGLSVASSPESPGTGSARGSSPAGHPPPPSFHWVLSKIVD